MKHKLENKEKLEKKKKWTDTEKEKVKQTQMLKNIVLKSCGSHGHGIELLGLSLV